MTLPVSNDDPATRSVDWSTTLPAGIVRKVASLDPDCDSLLAYNPGDTAMQLSRSSAIALDGTVQPGDYVLAPGATMTLPGGGEVFAHCSAARLLTLSAARRQRKSRRCLAATANRSMASVDNLVAGDAGVRTYSVWQQARGDTAIRDLELIYAAWYYTQGAGPRETDAANLPTISCDIEWPIGFKTRVTFGGSLTRVWAAGEALVSDVAPIRIPPGAWFRVNTCVAYATGATLGLFSLAPTTAFGGRIDQFQVGDRTMNTFAGASATYPFAPFAIMGTSEIDNPVSVLTFVDSIGQGVGALTSPDSGGNVGWPARLLYQLGGIPSVRIGRGGLTLSNIVGSVGTETAAATTRLVNLLRVLRWTHSMVQLASNDLSDGLNLPTTHLLLGKYQALSGGVPMAVGTVIPRSSGSLDGYTSVAGQTRVPYAAAIEGYNNALPTLGGISVIDAYSAVAAPGAGVNYGYWETDAGALVGDAVHPNGAGEARIAANRLCREQASAWLQR